MTNSIHPKEMVDCEICTFRSEKRFFKSYKSWEFLCPVCFNRESSLSSLSRELEQTDAATAKLRHINDVGENEDNPAFSSREAFFTAERTEIDKICSDGTLSEQIIALKQRNDQWQMVLFEAQSRQYAVYQKQQELTYQLRAEEREKLGIADSTYVTGGINPSNVKPTVKKERTSATDKALINMARLLFSKQLALLDLAQKAIFAEHPEYFSNGELVAQHREAYHTAILKFGALTLEQAVERARDMTRNAKAKQVQSLANGSLKLSEVPNKEA